MNRLTKRYANGDAGISALSDDVMATAYTGLSFGEIDAITAVIDKLADYEDAEEQRRLVRLPCRVGDTVWVIYQGYVASARAVAFYIDWCGGMFDLKIKTNIENTVGFETVYNEDYTFDDVFLTREDAEKALKKLRIEN